ncbi:WD40/YVTN/BNR-like repeat-containing protein [Paracnuella aquatica]|uniref:WD40/YVTN/BNR-like repeat-containing protein n=1 Tax=Paracnuella aquatica TaxID=2268757 RepID=UPI000DEF50D7|nr:YCF48-related protein [Paracnuella aquatica]RPD51591.1 oxidoreductase [Paracnuella aquatica]
MKTLTLCLLLVAATTFAQQKPEVTVLTSGTKTSLRGISVVNDRVVWVSGSNGTVARSTDGGKTWKWLVVKGFEQRDFRDIEAFDATTAIIMAIDAPAYILKTVDGGQTWKSVYENKTPGMFLDAMEFWNDQAGIVIGDPINGKVFVARTFDNGNTWKELPEANKPTVAQGEAFFASSGTNVRVLDKDEAVMVSGGTKSQVFIRDQKITLPLVQGGETTGANSVAVQDKNSRKGGNTMIVVGGDFTKPSSDSLNCFISTDRGASWKAPRKGPRGYRSAVEYLSKKHLVTCGPTGVDYSTDGGQTWKGISDEGFHAVRIAKNGSAVFLCGGNGKIAKLDYTKEQKPAQPKF